MANILTFKCTPVRQTFCSKDESYRIYATECYDKTIKTNSYGNVSILGSLPELSMDVEYTVKAVEENGKYGMSYRVKSIHRDKPLSDDGVRLFLEEILPYSQVEEIMKSYPNIIDLVLNDKMDEIDLSKLYNIKHERIKIIQRKILENFKFAEVIESFHGLLDFRMVKELYEHFKSVEKIKKEIQLNPYDVICSVLDLPFKKADAFLLSFEKKCNENEDSDIKFKEPLKSSKSRMEACMMHCLGENEFNGNTKMLLKGLKTKCSVLTKECIDKFDIVITDSAKFYIKDEFISKRTTYDSELYISSKIKEALILEQDVWNFNIENYVKTDEMELTDKQTEAIKNVLFYKVSILNGFGGSGKTASTTALVKLLKDHNKSITLLAPTGRASKVLSSYTSYTASTIHRLLYSLKSMKIETIDTDIVIVDEFSMCDVFVFEWLLTYIDFKRTKLMIIGDSAQLSSVGAGNCLHDLLNSQSIPTVWLDKIFRYGIGGVMTCATKTRQCEEFIEVKTGSQIIGEDKGYIFHHSIDSKTTMALIKKTYAKLLEKTPAEDILILSPYNIGENGSSVINKLVQPIANIKSLSSETFLESDNQRFYEGDLILQTKNNYKSQKFVNEGFDTNDSIEMSHKYGEDFNQTLICNGDVGKIERIYKTYCLINFDGIKVVYDTFELETCKLGYSISITKSQGGNAKYVILITAKDHETNLSSNQLYVGQTRAREKVIHIGNVSTVNKCVKKKDEESRLTWLRELLEDEAC